MKDVLMSIDNAMHRTKQIARVCQNRLAVAFASLQVQSYNKMIEYKRIWLHFVIKKCSQIAI